MKKKLIISCLITNSILCDNPQNGKNLQENAYKLLASYANKTNGNIQKPIKLSKNNSASELLQVPANASLTDLRGAYLKLLKTFEYLKKQSDMQNLYNELKTTIDNAYSLLKHYKLIDSTLTERSTPYEILGVQPNASKSEINKAFSDRAKKIEQVKNLREPNNMPNGLMEQKIVGDIIQKAYDQAVKGKS